MQTWELLIALAREKRVKQIVVIPEENKNEFNRTRQLIIHQFDLKEKSVKFLPVISEKPEISKKELMLKRDQMIIMQADILVPVSIREKGQILSLMNKYTTKGKSIEPRFRIEYERRIMPLGYRISEEILNRDILSIGDKYITHWTRTSNSAWPTERLIDYYRAISASDRYPRSAIATLRNIIATNKIIASSRNMPGNTATVSFSGLPPSMLVPLVRWRARHSQMSFEPYGIGIKKEYTKKLGIFPVQYYRKSLHIHTKAERPWLRQSAGMKSNWKQEREFRHLGNFDLSHIPTDKLICFCFTSNEASYIESYTGIKTVSFLP